MMSLYFVLSKQPEYLRRHFDHAGNLDDYPGRLEARSAFYIQY